MTNVAHYSRNTLAQISLSNLLKWTNKNNSPTAPPCGEEWDQNPKLQQYIFFNVKCSNNNNKKIMKYIRKPKCDPYKGGNKTNQ